MKDIDAPKSTRVSASKIFLELSLKGFEITELLERIESLEQAVAAQ